MLVFNPLLDPKNKDFVKAFNFFVAAQHFVSCMLFDFTTKILRLGTTPQNAFSLYLSGICYFNMNDRINC